MLNFYSLITRIYITFKIKLLRADDKRAENLSTTKAKYFDNQFCVMQKCVIETISQLPKNIELN